MDFNSFLSKIEQFKSSKVGGQNAQFKLAPSQRIRFNIEKIMEKNPKKAAVLVLFYPNKQNETTFLLTERAHYNGTHASQISFPGGKFEENDMELSTTALRESNEEVGINLNEVTVFKKMSDVYIPPSNFLVTPFLAYTKKTPKFSTNYEVENIIEVSLKSLFNNKFQTTTLVTTSYAKNWEVPCYAFNNFNIWGATAMMLSEIKQLLSNA
ncbi:MAG TPA: CoA pyrophosphatase [Flavobacteriaceae bacterium]|nr:CoA pyrophosphatase [Flavobacteriaceae bacterium]